MENNAKAEYLKINRFSRSLIKQIYPISNNRDVKRCKVQIFLSFVSKKNYYWIKSNFNIFIFYIFFLCSINIHSKFYRNNCASITLITSVAVIQFSTSKFERFCRVILIIEIPFTRNFPLYSLVSFISSYLLFLLVRTHFGFIHLDLRGAIRNKALLCRFIAQLTEINRSFNKSLMASLSLTISKRVRRGEFVLLQIATQHAFYK